MHKVYMFTLEAVVDSPVAQVFLVEAVFSGFSSHVRHKLMASY